MADIRRLTTTRGAHRGQMTKLLKKLEETKSNFDGVPSQTQTQTFRALYESVLTKLDYLKKLDDTILEATETDELAEAIVESDDYINYLQIQIGFNDAFTSAVDNDSNLDDIQKFQYLIAQLTGDASKAIEGLQLTSANYGEALELLRKRYGQTHKLISSYMKALWELPKPSNSLESVRKFYDNLETYVRGLKSLGKSEDSYGDLLVPIVFEKLPGQIRTHISREHGDSAWTLTELKDSLYKEIQAAQAGDNNYLGSTTDVSSTSAFSITTKPTYRKFCAFCGGAHFHNDCVVVSDKRKCMDIVKRAHLCFNCLKGKHCSSECLARGRCHICQRKHHTSLCNANTQTGSRPAETKGLDQPQPNQETRTHVTLTPTSGPVLLKTAVGTIESRVGPATNINILFDEGAQRSFITSTAAKRLGIDSDNCETENVQLATFGTNSHGVQSVHITPLKLITRDGRVDIRALIVPKISAPMKNYMESTVKSYPYLQNLTLARPVHADVFEIDLLLGADYYWSIVGNGVIRGPGPTAVSSKLGFLLSGPTNLKTDVSVYQTICLKVATDMIDTHQDISKLSRYWDLETIGITDDDNIPHTKSFEKFRDENIRMVGGKYSAKLPWRENNPPLPTNYRVCSARTRTMIRNLSPQLLDTYNTIITEQLSRGFIERVLDDDATHGHYIPHHCVKKDSTTTPIRIVYDCSCRQSDNPSLNQCLETGPPLLNYMVGILLRFHVNEVAFTADIEKAFLNVQLDQHDRDYTKFLWLSNPDDPESAFNTYRFKVVLFGATCSPFILNAVVKTHLESNPGDASADLTMNTYMDNVISGVRSQSMSPESVSQSAINYYSVADDVMQKGGFKLRMWATNDPMLRQIAQNDGNNDPENSVNVVGLRWLTNNDMLTYAGDSNPNTSVLTTKREIVRTTSSLFDPSGLLAPVHVQAKLFIQQLWQENKQWDELLTDDLSPKWTSIRNELESAKDIVFRRPYFNGHSNADYELHVFADASTRAYGAVTYLKRGNETAIVMAKTRIKPPKDMTLPRMELMAALIGARLAKFVTKELSNINLTKRVLWCDSQIVIHWLQSDKKLPIFVENRVKEIRATKLIKSNTVILRITLRTY